MPQPEKYSAMEHFQKKGIDYLFRQPPTTVLAVVFLGVVLMFSFIMWKKIDRTEQNCDGRIKEVNKEWAEAMNKNNISLNHCMAQKDTLFKMYAVLSARFTVLDLQMRKVERNQRSN